MTRKLTRSLTLHISFAELKTQKVQKQAKAESTPAASDEKDAGDSREVTAGPAVKLVTDDSQKEGKQESNEDQEQSKTEEAEGKESTADADKPKEPTPETAESQPEEATVKKEAESQEAKEGGQEADRDETKEEPAAPKASEEPATEQDSKDKELEKDTPPTDTPPTDAPQTDQAAVVEETTAEGDKMATEGVEVSGKEEGVVRSEGDVGQTAVDADQADNALAESVVAGESHQGGGEMGAVKDAEITNTSGELGG